MNKIGCLEFCTIVRFTYNFTFTLFMKETIDFLLFSMCTFYVGLVVLVPNLLCQKEKKKECQDVPREPFLWNGSNQPSNQFDSSHSSSFPDPIVKYTFCV